MFSDLLAGLDAEDRRRVAYFEQLIERSLPFGLRLWLYLLDRQLRTLALHLVQTDPQRFLKILWYLWQLPADLLPDPRDVHECSALLFALARHHETPHGLDERPADVTRLRSSSLDATGMRGLVRGIRGRSGARETVQRQIRGTDERFDPAQTQIYAPWILQNREALRNLVQQVSGCEALFSLERGGSLVADHLAMLLRNRPSVKVPKIYTETVKPVHPRAPPGTLPRIVREYSRLDHIALLRAAIQNQIGADTNRQVSIAVTESLVSGSSANTLMQSLGTMVNTYPNLNIRFAFERHTFNRGDDLIGRDFLQLTGTGTQQRLNLFRGGEFLTIPRATQVMVFIANARYILGEDVGYQLAYTGPNAGQPLVVFNEVRGEVRAIMLDPSRGHTAREILIRLILGVYDDILNELELI